ncbi:MAG: sirohydrochlorin cobaltochelatase [Proteobacteria bacterium]|nr:sirohydrochlorin cobaltochelatase [Pseudomonadota bacterium]
MKLKSIFFAVAVLCLGFSLTSQASGDYEVKHKNAIVLAMFGTTVEPALQGLLNIRSKIIAKYPDTTVRVAFTSNIIRKKWQHRAEDMEYIKAHPEIPKDILHVKTPLATIADLQDDGYDTIVIQPTHISMGEEFLDLHTYVDALMNMGTLKKAKYKPFHKVALGRPALGTYGKEHPYTEDISTAAEIMAPDVQFANKEKAGLVYMGHGNKFFPGNGGIYLELAAKMRKTYPDVVTAIGNVEGYPAIEDVMETLKLYGVKKVILKPFMVVAGDHSMNDMASAEDDSWKSILEKNGFEVIVVAVGLGENDKFADIFVNHAADAAKDAGIILK